MADKSSIEWTDATWNPLAGCTKVSPGCANCYAEIMARRLKAMGNINYQGVVDNKGRWSGQIALIPSVLENPLKWKRPRKIFVNSMSDLFHPTVPTGYIYSVFQVMLEANWHIFQVLTKRPERMAEVLLGADWWYKLDPESRQHIHLGTSAENQQTYDERVPYLLRTPASVRFLSCEPLLGFINLGLLGTVPKSISIRYQLVRDMIHWVIVGGESGPKARPMHPEWVTSIRDQCHEAETPFLFKQWGAWSPELDGLTEYGKSRLIERGVGRVAKGYYIFMDKTIVRKLGKHAAGRLLDGRTWDEYPEERS